MHIALGLSDPAVKLLYLAEAERVLEALHAHAVLHLCKEIFRTAADSHRRRIGRNKVGVFLLNSLELALEHIVFIVLYLGVIVDIILFAVIIELVSELLCALCALFLIRQKGFLL